jgi:serine/threonine-protein phosphatase CPPED1
LAIGSRRQTLLALRLGLTLTLVGACRLGHARPETEPFFFIQMSDPQFGFITANADFTQETINFEKAVAAANRLRPAFVVVTGDLTHRQGDAAQIAEYRRIAAKLDRSIPLYNVAGNHDVSLPMSDSSLAAYRRIYGPDYYEFDAGRVHGIVINSSLIKDTTIATAQTNAQTSWFRRAITARRDTSRVTIVFQHHPWFLMRSDEPDQYYNLPLGARRTYLDLFARNGITHVFAGHYHRNALAVDGALEMVTTGPVGKPMGADSSGIRVVFVDGTRVTHRYYPLDSIPTHVAPPLR